MEPLEYLTERVSKVVVGSDKIYNEGARLLAHHPLWTFELEDMVNESWDVLMKYCIRNKNSTHKASAKLTFASNLIGKRLAAQMRIDENDIKNTLSLGDVMLESFLQAGLIEINREYNGYKAPYMVKLVGTFDGVKPVLRGTTTMPLPKIIGLYSPLTREPFIKGWTDTAVFSELLSTRFVKSLDILRGTAWALNEPVLEALMANPPASTIKLVDDDGVIHETPLKEASKKLKHLDGTQCLGKKDPKVQKMISKAYEYQMIVAKASMVKSNGYPFYQEVSCDYRGRVYYAESFLEFQGSDQARSLFLFNEKKVVTERGYYWLSVHTATCYSQSYSIDELADHDWMEEDYTEYLSEAGLDSISVDKMTLNDRFNWTQMHLDDIISYAENKEVLDDAEKPYSFLACCLEVYNYNTSSGPYESGFPIPIDGSNNG